MCYVQKRIRKQSKICSIRGKAPSLGVSVVYSTTTEKSKVKPAAIRGGGYLAFSYKS